jgi:hypothetical protein
MVVYVCAMRDARCGFLALGQAVIMSEPILAIKYYASLTQRS